MNRWERRKNRRLRKFTRSEKGQISIMVGMMMMTFILFFAFVVNTGMLVNARINIQNAADLAAYAGAAVQARQLTNISYLNYEMRRQWKKFLFRTYVLGNMAQDSFPKSASSGPMQYIPDNVDPQDYLIPSTCVIFNAGDNYCHLTALPGITMPSGPGAIDDPTGMVGDAITMALKTQLQELEKIRKTNCKSIGVTNKILNLYWLFNADPSMAALERGALTTEQKNALKIVRGLATGIGIVPREAILKMRTKTLAGYVNMPPLPDLNLDTVRNSLMKSRDVMANERSIQAFYSAYYSLGNHTFPAESIRMDELLPVFNSKARLLELKEIGTTFATFAVDFEEINDNCQAVLIPIRVNRPVTLGFYKSPDILTYYAVRLRAKAKILFSPFGEIEMKAYAAAQPFGSRIGPSDVAFATLGPQNQWVKNLNTYNYPNLAVEDDDPSITAKGSGWDTKDMVGQMYVKLIQAGGGMTIDPSVLETKVYPLAMMPNPWEKNRYNIMSDVANDSFVQNFGANNNTPATLWAPIVSPLDERNLIDMIRESVVKPPDTIDGNNSTDPSVNDKAAISAIQQSVAKDLEIYITSKLQNGEGEDGETVQMVKISNPFIEGAQMNADLFVGSPLEVRTSWNKVNDGNIRREGRVGYSVKFVSFESLTKDKIRTSNVGASSGGSLQNDLPSDTESDHDIPFLRH